MKIKFFLALVIVLVSIVAKGETYPTAKSSTQQVVLHPVYPTFLVTINGTTIDLAKIGQYHNQILSYVKANQPPVGNQSLCGLFDAMKIGTLNGYNAIGNDAANYFTMQNSNCADLPSLFTYPMSQITTSSIVNTLHINFGELLAKGAIIQEERDLLHQYINQAVSGQTIDYNLMRTQWEAIPNKPYGGAFSASFLVLGAYSSEWWAANDPTFDDDGPQFWAWAAADLGGLAFGTAKYMIQNWDKHYRSEFGINSLKSGAWDAVEASTLGMFGR